ncbi:hypothetical protein GXB85_04750 [Cellulomonas sp. APG4]|uniref:hypothetical protein n=1 Tax=Cellulomonas sp. APG4 TaxID=1538656 RepID=UPI00137AEF8E|nr:hypothetical protein [Cellulomonas sp. APG4]NCT90263.1 hypothetical protein [Cellulomonas sp. APG4]
MPGTADWPRLQRRLARTLRAVIYGFAALAAAGVLVWQPPPIVAAIGPGGLYALGVVGALAGAAALVASLTHRWRAEWVATWFVAAAFAAYTTIDWAMVLVGHYGRIPGSAVLTALTAAIAARGVDLWVFHLETSHARRARVRRWRTVAGLVA